jgi:hypothetical protein
MTESNGEPQRVIFVTRLSTAGWMASLVTMQQSIDHCMANTGNKIILSTTTLIRKKEMCVNQDVMNIHLNYLV